jgi:hypothetical protein
MATEYNVRVSDADRDTTAAQLREHYAQGRLTLDELNQRLELTFAARTRTDLDAVTRDLPYAAPHGALPSDRARQGGQGSSGRYRTGPAWGSQGWTGGDSGTSGGFRGSPVTCMRFIPLLVSLGICFLVLSALGFGFGSGGSLWVVVLAALGALRWIFGRRRGRGRMPFPVRGRGRGCGRRR